MKKQLALILCMMPIMAFAYIDRNPADVHVEIKDKKPHTEVNPPADMPDVYYNSELDVITIVDYANVTYYVTIYDDWWNVVITDTKVGGGTIDVSSLTSGDYVIDISTSWNHDFEGQFTVP